MRFLSTTNPFSSRWTISPRNLTPSFLFDEDFEDFDHRIRDNERRSFTGRDGFLPNCDIHETKDHYWITMDVPGVRKEDLKIEVKGNRLLVSGERQREVKESQGDLQGESLIRHERAYGKFERAFQITDAVNSEKIEAQYENGVLNVALPKAEVAKGRTIQIQSGDTSFFNKLLN